MYKKTYLLLKECSPLLAYDFRYNLYVAFVISRLVLVAGPSFAVMNPKYFHTTLFFNFWVVIKFWGRLTGFPRGSLHDLDESMSVLWFENDNLLSLSNACKTYFLTTKQIKKNCIFGKVKRF
jgi:hypothetical protein